MESAEENDSLSASVSKLAQSRRSLDAKYYQIALPISLHVKNQGFSQSARKSGVCVAGYQEERILQIGQDSSLVSVSIGILSVVLLTAK